MTDEQPKKPRGRPTTLDADLALHKAMEAYWHSDPADVSINAICQIAGVSKPSLYRAFGSEDGLMSAALALYAKDVLVEIFDILGRGRDLKTTLDALVQFASIDPKMNKGCLFFKMRAGKHRLGPLSRAKVEEIDAAAVAAFETYLAGAHVAGMSVSVAARYLTEQIGLALTQRAGGLDPATIRRTLELALSVLLPAGEG